jgi:hypothetical protein
MPKPPYWSISGKRSGPSNYDGIKMPSRLDNVSDLQNLVAAMRTRGLDQPAIEEWLGIPRMQRHAKDVSILRLLTGRRNSASLCEHDINIFASSDLRI